MEHIVYIVKVICSGAYQEFRFDNSDKAYDFAADLRDEGCFVQVTSHIETV